jgi:hypothetical protein
MRALSIACLLSILPVAALADTLQVLSPPSPAPYHQPGTPQLRAAINFAGDGSVYSACKYTTGETAAGIATPPKPSTSPRMITTGSSPPQARSAPRSAQGSLRTADQS